MNNELDLDGFERYCKNIKFKSSNPYKNYLKNGIKVLNAIRKGENYSALNLDDKIFKNDFKQYVKDHKLHNDLYNDFKSAFKK